jgi:hypothetical protein
MNISVLILAAGQVGFETRDGGYPICLTEFDGLSLLERIVANTRNIEKAQYAFALLNTDAERFHLDKVAKLLSPNAIVIRTPESTQGSACTALLAASQLSPESELLIISANELVDIDFAEVVGDFRRRKLDGGLLVFRSVHPRYSYVRLNTERLVTEAAQQDPISHHATAGVFWFARTGAFVDAAKNLIRKNASVNGKFYVAPTFNELVLKQGRVGVSDLDLSKYRPLKTERQVEQFEHGAPV